MKRAAIIGTGLIGRGWAVVFARAGWRVCLWDRDAQAADIARTAIAASLADLEAAGLAKHAGDLIAHVTVAPTLSEAVAQADYVQECGPEDAGIKAAIIAGIDACAPDHALIGSSTSTMPGSRFLSDVPGRDRAMVAHPANPPHLMAAVELVPSDWHTPAVTERFADVLRTVGQVPVIVDKEIEGFVMNRLQTAVVNEAIALVARGVIDPEGLDAVMTHSLGLRWALMGPFQTMDLNAPDGFYDYASRYGSKYQAMGSDLFVADPWPDSALKTIEAARRADCPKAEIPLAMQRRDRALMRLLAMKSEMESQL